MTRYLMYKLGVAVLFYAVYYMRPTLVYGLKTADPLQNKSHISNENYFVYYQGVEGIPGTDFPVLSHIPKTAFSCHGLESGYYADMNADCQVFHICEEKRKISFLCPNGTIFDQSELICEWWFKVNCTQAGDLYRGSAETLREQQERRRHQQLQQSTSDKNLLNHGAVMRTEQRSSVSVVQNGRRVQPPNSINASSTDTNRNSNFVVKSNNQHQSLQRPIDLSGDIAVNYKPSGVKLKQQKPDLVGEIEFVSVDKNVNAVRNVVKTVQQSVNDTNRRIELDSNRSKGQINGHSKLSTSENRRGFSVNASNVGTSQPNDLNSPLYIVHNSQDIQGSNPVKKNIIAAREKSGNSIAKQNSQSKSAFPNRNSPFTTLVIDTLSGQRFSKSDIYKFHTDTNLYSTATESSNTYSNSNYRHSVRVNTTPQTYYNANSKQHLNRKKTSPPKMFSTKVLGNNVKNSTILSSVTTSPSFSRATFTSTTVNPTNRRMLIDSDLKETQILEETTISSSSATFRNNKIMPSTNILYPNHRSTYSELMPKPKLFSTKVVQLSSVTPHYITTQPINNGKPFLGSQVGTVFHTTVKPFLMQFNFRKSNDNQTVDKNGVRRPAISTEIFNADRGPPRPLVTTTQRSEPLTFTAIPKTKFNTAGHRQRKISLPVSTQQSRRNDVQSRGRYNTGTVFNSTNVAFSTIRPLDHATVYGKFINYTTTTASSPIPTSRSGSFKGFKQPSNSNDVYAFKNFPSPSPPSSFRRVPQPSEIPQTNIKKSGFYITKSENPLSYTVTTVQPKLRSLDKSSAPTRIPLIDNGKTFFGKVSKPRPFHVPSRTQPAIDNSIITTNHPPPTQIAYKLSTSRPFSTRPIPVETLNLASSSSFLPTNYKPAMVSTISNNNGHNMMNALVALSKMNEDFSGESARPGLVIPPSVGPQTLHTLAVYFANALDSFVDNDFTISTTKRPKTNKEKLTELLTRMTMNGYRNLFAPKKNTAARTDGEVESNLTDSTEEDTSDLEGQHSKRFDDSMKIRQLARLFTQALSSYLDDPDTFKRILAEVRPTEPPLFQHISATTIAGDGHNEDELLNFSDTDAKSSYPPIFPTVPSIQPTWGYLIAYNSSSSKSKVSSDGDVKNSLQNDVENLQGADTQSFVPRYNDVNNAEDYDDSTTGFSTTIGTTDRTTTFSNEVAETTTTTLYSKQQLPQNHWTTSEDATKLWKSAFGFNPANINEHFTTTEETPFSTFATTPGGSDLVDYISTVTTDYPDFTTEIPAQIPFSLPDLPRLNLNQSQVHGMLLDLMSHSHYNENSRLQRILRKLNTSEAEFLEKMREIEANPLTRRLILLLISECGTNATREIHTEAVPVRSLLKTTKNRTNSPPEILQSASSSSNALSPQRIRSVNSQNHVQSTENNEDERALQLLNSLYSIASKFG